MSRCVAHPPLWRAPPPHRTVAPPHQLRRWCHLQGAKEEKRRQEVAEEQRRRAAERHHVLSENYTQWGNLRRYVVGEDGEEEEEEEEHAGNTAQVGRPRRGSFVVQGTAKQVAARPDALGHAHGRGVLPSFKHRTDDAGN